MKNRILLADARVKLSRLWFVWGFFIFSVVVLQSIFGKYGGQVKEAWSWFIPTLLPTLSLMIGVLGAAALVTEDDIRTLNVTFYEMTFWISIGYLFILSITIALEPIAPMGTIELYLLSNYWLGPLQGIVGGAIGLLFTSQKQEPFSAKPNAGNGVPQSS